ncbi:MAG: hypothetical protein ABI560_09415 [Myxococcales bacterium]
MRALLSLSGALALTVGLASGACSYDPKFADGTLQCSSSGECPENYSCRASDRTCVSRHDAPVNLFVGTWTLAPTSTVTTRCANSPAPIVAMLSPATEPSRMTITAGVVGQYDLDSEWLCPLHLRVDGTGAHLSDNRPCSAAGTAPVTTQTWTATQFDILANTGTTAMHVAAYTRVDLYADGSMVTCMQMVTAPLTKP